jgi:hypothetical protein
MSDNLGLWLVELCFFGRLELDLLAAEDLRILVAPSFGSSSPRIGSSAVRFFIEGGLLHRRKEMCSCQLISSFCLESRTWKCCLIVSGTCRHQVIQKLVWLFLAYILIPDL